MTKAMLALPLFAPRGAAQLEDVNPMLTREHGRNPLVHPQQRGRQRWQPTMGARP
jgi:hypothetical protein